MSKEAMKLALEALEEINKLSIGANAVCLPAEIDTAMDALREALAEQKSGIKQVIELYDSPDQPSQQEPVAWMRQDGQRVTTASDRHNYPDYETRYSIPLYTTPPQRTWVGLTESEITTSLPYSVTRDKGCFHAGALWAEAKLKEKNNA